MVALEIPSNTNCAAVDLRVFHDLSEPQPVRRVRLAQWCDVTGWTASGAPCPATVPAGAA